MFTEVENRDEDKALEPRPARLMDIFIKNSPTLPEVGSLIEGTVIGKGKMALYVDLSPFGTGLIFGREYLNARDVIKKVSPGDKITAKILESEGENGYIELSLKEAKQAQFWTIAEDALKRKEAFLLTIKDANKGGLIVVWQNMDGFIPASQLKPEHYPRVEDGDKDRIADELRKLIGETLSVVMIGVDPKENKLIFSEKETGDQSREERVSRYHVGDVLDGEVTGAVDFGVFVKVEDGLEGLVHISEMDWALVEDPRKMFTVGEKVKVKVIEVKEGKISLSIKQLKTNPWSEAGAKYEKGSMVKGVVIRFNKYGALVSIEEGVAGLCHVSEFGTEDKLRAKLELGKTYSFKINVFEPKEQKMTLSFVEA